MARAFFPCAGCGESVTIYGRNRRDADSKAAWHEKEKHLCDDCKQKELEVENKKAAQDNAAAGLPKLQGTEKQILWAESIRRQKLKAISDLSEELSQSEDPTLIAELLRRASSVQAASWWIDRRDFSGQEIARQIAKQMKDDGFVPRPEEERNAAIEAEKEAKAEATVYPENPKSATIAEIRHIGDKLQIYFPEKREDFRQLVKFELGYIWDKTLWSRAISFATGLFEDRIAEAGHRLLAAGFPIRIFDEALRQRAISGEFDPEHTRWVFKNTANGSFMIHWGRHEDFYQAARKIPRSRYERPYVTVPSEQYEEVLDFSERFGFRLSPGAEALAKEAEEARSKAMIAKVKPKPKPEKVKADLAPPVLNPEDAEQEISNELRDED